MEKVLGQRASNVSGFRTAVAFHVKTNHKYEGLEAMDLTLLKAKNKLGPASARKLSVTQSHVDP